MKISRISAVMISVVLAFTSGTYSQTANEIAAMNAQASGKTDEALALYTKEIKANPSWGAYQLRGNLYTELKKYDLAVADYTRSIEIRETASSYKLRGETYFAWRKYDLALADLKRSVQLGNDDSETLIVMARIYQSQGDEVRALEMAKAAVKAENGSALSIVGRGNLYLAQKKYDLALADFDAARKMADPFGQRIAPVARAWTYFLKGQYALAAAEADAIILKRLTKTLPEDLQHNCIKEAVIVGYFAKRKLRNDVGAKALVEKAIISVPKKSWPLLLAVYLHGEFTEEELLIVADDDQKKVQAHLCLGEMKLLRGERAGATEQFKFVVENAEKDSSVYQLANAEFAALMAKP